jgi:flagellar M-ring protein FliF
VNQLAPFLRESSPKSKIALAVGAAVTLVVFFLLFQMATRPSYDTMMSGLDPADTGKVTAALDETGVTYELQNGGTAVGVLPADAARARVALAEAGIQGAGKAQPGMELFDEQKLGTSDFQQKVNYQRALEGEIARTIQQVDGVSGAKVQLVLPEDQLFAEDAKPATAAVLLSGATASMDPGAIRGMAQLVSSSVEGLKPEKVTITDGSGAMLWPREGGDAGAAPGSALAKQAAEERRDQALESQLMAMLAGAVGPDKARVQVTSQLNLDRAKERKLTYDRRGVPIKRSTETEQLEGQGAGRAGGTAGTAGNVPGYTGRANGAGDSNYERETESTDFGVGRTVRDTEFAPGAVEKQSVAVLLDASVPDPVATELQKAVAAAAGIDTLRGDTLSVNRVAFAKAPAAAKPSPIAGYAGYAKWAALGLAALLFLFFVTRHLRRREGEALGEPVWLREITAPQPLAALEAEAPTALLSPARPRTDVRRKAEEIAAKEPAKVAQQLRSWMQEGA